MFYFGWSSPIFWRCLPPRLPSPLAGWCPSLWEHRSTLYLHLDPNKQQTYDVGSLINENGCDKVSDQKPTKSTGSAHRGQASLTLINELGFCGSAKDKKLCLGVPEEQKMSPGPCINNINLKLILKKPVIVNIHEYTEIHIMCNFSNTCIEQILPKIDFSMKVTIQSCKL